MAELAWRLLADFMKKHPRILLRADSWTRGRGRVHWRSWFATPQPPRLRGSLAEMLAAPLGACWIGHGTMLLRVAGVTVLVDPVFSDRVGPHVLGVQVGPKRLVAPAVRPEDLPPVDVVLLTHAHFDHLDLPSLHRLKRGATLVTCPGITDLVAPLRFQRHVELAARQHVSIGGVEISGVPVNHWGARCFVDTHRGYCGFLLKGKGHRVLVAGDTAATDLLSGFGPVDLLCIGIGAYDPYVAAHATPEQAAEIAQSVVPSAIAAIHHSTFRLGHEPDHEPLERFLKTPVAGKVVMSRVGDVWCKGGQPTPPS